jgi:hypothetical protein
MLLHHIATVTLYFGMILNNNLTQGMLGAWLHLIADIPGAGAKLFSQTRLSMVTLINFLVTIVLWFWTRNYIFVKMTYSICSYLWYSGPFEQF